MTYLKNNISSIVFCFTSIILITSCETHIPKITPTIITEKTANDADDPAIWINRKDPSKSIIFGTDKNTNGAIYAFDLNGKIIKEKSIFNIARPNNVDITYNLRLNDSTKVDVLAFTEREKQQVRLFSIPNMLPLDNGGFKVFQDESNIAYKLPMGIAFYTSKNDTKTYVIISRKKGPKHNYLYQYEVKNKNGKLFLSFSRKFGDFSGNKEIEAIAVDNEQGVVYYSDEQHCIRKYYADPNKGNEELNCFGGHKFKSDIEGIAIAKTGPNSGYLIISDQQRGTFNIFDREQNTFIKTINLSTIKTDGCDVTTFPLTEKFSDGLFVAMNDEKNFYFYNLKNIIH